MPMDIKDPKLKKFINQELVGGLADCQKESALRYKELKEAIEDAKYINLKNGDNKQMLLKDAIPHIHNDVKSLMKTVDELAKKTIYGWIKNSYEKNAIKTLLWVGIAGVIGFLFILNNLGIHSVKDIVDIYKAIKGVF